MAPCPLFCRTSSSARPPRTTVALWGCSMRRLTSCLGGHLVLSGSASPGLQMTWRRALPMTPPCCSPTPVLALLWPYFCFGTGGGLYCRSGSTRLWGATARSEALGRARGAAPPLRGRRRRWSARLASRPICAICQDADTKPGGPCSMMREPSFLCSPAAAYSRHQPFARPSASAGLPLTRRLGILSNVRCSRSEPARAIVRATGRRRDAVPRSA